MKLFLSLLLLFAATVSSAQASASIFLRVKQSSGSPAIVGDSTVAAFPGQEGWFELLSCSLAIENNTTFGPGTGPSAGKVQFSPLRTVKFPNKATAAFFTACAAGSQFQEFEVAFAQNSAQGLQRTMTIDLKSVLVQSIGLSGSGGGDRPSEDVSFIYQAYRITFFAPDQTGTYQEVGKTSWNLKTNTGTY